MALSSIQTDPLRLLTHTGSDLQTIKRHIRVLVISPRLEDRQRLVHVLEAVSADVIACSSRMQAEQVLTHQTFEIVFCDERLPDGSYSDLLHREHSVARVVVTTRTGDWDLYCEAVGKGAFDVIRSPAYATDVEMIVIRAIRENLQIAFPREVV